ncbi:MAG: CBS domain-containing protein, partial [Promethearchaeota archaeon]
PDLVVVEEKSDKVLGVIADFDIIQNVVAKGSDPKEEMVISTMYKIKSMSLDDLVTEAFARMRDLNVNVVPVVENEKLVGVCTIQDCWSYIPDEDFDEVGFISVSDTRSAEFWFATVCVIIAFVFGVIFPLVGIFGFFSGNPAELLSFFGMASIEGQIVLFGLFEARGINFLVPFVNLINTNGIIWLIIVISSVLIVIFGILALFSIIFSSYSRVRNVQTGFLVQFLLPILFIVFLIINWVLLGIAFAIAVPTPNVTVDGVGLTLSIISMILVLAAIYRDYFFRQKESANEVPR